MMKKLLLALVAFLLSCSAAWADSNTITSPLGFPLNPGDLADSAANYVLIGPYTGTKLQNYRTLNVLTSQGLTYQDNGAKNPVTIGTSATLQYFNGLGVTTQQGLANATFSFASKATGDMWYYDGTNVTRIPKAADGTVLTLVSGVPTWTTAGAGAPAAAQYILGAANGTLTNGMVLTQGSGISVTNVVGSTSTVAVDSTVIRTTGAQSLAGPKTLSGGPIIAAAQTNGLVLRGSTFNDTILISDPAAARTLTIPDPGTNAFFVMTEGAQTINGAKTFASGALKASNIVNGAGTLTLPTSTDTLVGRATTDTLTNKTLTAPIFSTNSFTLQQVTANYTVQWANPAAARTYTITDVGIAADFAMKTGAYTAGGVAYGDGNKLLVSGASGASGIPLLSGGSGAPTFAVLGISGGGTNNGSLSVTSQNLLITDGTKVIGLAKGTANQTLQMDGTGTNVQWGTGGTGTIGGSIAANQVAVGSGANTIAGSAQFTQTTSAGVSTITLGDSTTNVGQIALQKGAGGQNAGLNIQNGTSGTTNLRTAPTGSPTVVLPGVNTTEVTTQSTGGQLLVTDSSGVRSYIETNLKAYRILKATRQLPTTGTWSGVYWHFGNWTQTGTITINPGTRVYVNGSMTFSTSNNTVQGGLAHAGGAKSPAITMYAQNGSGPGAPSYGPVFANSVAGGGGGGSPGNPTTGGNGAGGNGGSATASVVNYGGNTYDWHECLNGSSGMGGNATTAGNGGNGGAGVAGVYIECTGAFSCPATGVQAPIQLVGGTASNASGVNGGGGGGGGGAAFILRCGSTVDLGSSTATILVSGGLGGNPTSSAGGNGGGGAGGVIDITAAGTITNSLVAATCCGGGAAGIGGSATSPGSAGQQGILTLRASTTPVSEF